ncbi:MAG: Rrf2 family transcriptional regulator [Syntrophomonadaceae bacterium]
MQITRQSEYAIRTMLELAKAPAGELLSTRYVSEQQDIPEDFLKKTVKLLVLADLVYTQRGTNGGIRLLKCPDQITILDIVTAVEGPLALNVCLAPGYQCPNKPGCPVSAIMARAQQALARELSASTLADILSQAK